METMDMDTVSGTPVSGRSKAKRRNTSALISIMIKKIHAVPMALSPEVSPLKYLPAVSRHPPPAGGAEGGTLAACSAISGNYRIRASGPSDG